MAAGRYNFFCEQGATFNPTISWVDDEGVAVDLSTYEARMQVRPTVPSASVIFEVTSASPAAASGGITLGGSAGTIEIVLEATATDDLPTGTFRYDLELEAPDGFVTRLLKGRFKIDPEVTR